MFKFQYLKNNRLEKWFFPTMYFILKYFDRKSRYVIVSNFPNPPHVCACAALWWSQHVTASRVFCRAQFRDCTRLYVTQK